MTARRYKAPDNRSQSSLFPPSLDDYVSPDNPVRAIDAYVNTLSLDGLGFQYTQPTQGSGQPPYHPGDLLKLYLYGYINHVRSSRKLERETYRNVEVMWLVGRLHPSYKTIADFRKANPGALKATNRDFILLCRELDLFGGKKVAIDGSFFRGNASKASIHTEKKLKKQIEELDAKITAYQNELAENDRCDDKESNQSIHEDPELGDKLERLKGRQVQKQQQLQSLQTSDETQISTTDPDARLLSKSGQRVAGYNVQTAIDDKHHLLVCSQVTNDGNDFHQLYPMATHAKETLVVEELIALADAGYYEGDQLKQCEDHQITPYVPEPDKTQAVKTQGRYTRNAFTYDAERNLYHCPQGHALKQRGKPHKKNDKMRIRYASQTSVCNACPVRNKCLSDDAQTRQIYRWEHEDVLERHRKRMQDSAQAMTQRASLVEHPFGTLKDRAGWTYHFLVRGFRNVRGEWSIMAMGYNFTRVLNIIGIDVFMAYCAQRNQSQ